MAVTVIISKARGLGGQEEEEDTKYNTLIAVYFKLNLITKSISNVEGKCWSKLEASKTLSAHYHHR